MLLLFNEIFYISSVSFSFVEVWHRRFHRFASLYIHIYIYIYITYLLNYLRTTRNRVLLEKLTGSQLVKEFPAFCGTRIFITAFTSARHLSLFCTSSIQSIPPHSTSWRSILILPSIYTWIFQVVSFPQMSPPKSCVCVCVCVCVYVCVCTAIILSDNYYVPIPVCSFVLLTQSTPPTAQTLYRNAAGSYSLFDLFRGKSDKILRWSSVCLVFGK